MKKIFDFVKGFLNFVKHNIFLIFAAYWFIDFVIGFITINPFTLDATTRKIKALELGSDLLWTLVFTLEYTVINVARVLNGRVDLANKRIDLLFDFIEEAAKLMESEEAKESEEKKEEAKEEKEVE